MIIYVQVTQEDIDRGARGDPKACPIALAVMRHFDIDADVIVDADINVDTYEAWYYGVLPEEAIDFMVAFDNDDSVGPINFDLDLSEY